MAALRNDQLIELRRQEVIADYNAAETSNRRRFIEEKGKGHATAEYIFENQKNDSTRVVHGFYKDNIRVASIEKLTKVGADGVIIEIAVQMTTHHDNNFIINHENVRIITGMSNLKWQTEMKDKAPNCFKNKIFHHGQLHNANLNNLQDGLLIFDETDAGDKPMQRLDTLLKNAGILDINYIINHNIRIVFISATMIKELGELYKWGVLHCSYKMTIPSNYIGHDTFLAIEIIQEFYSMEKSEDAQKWIQEDILDNYENDFRVHIARVNLKSRNSLQNACIRMNITFRDHTSTDRLSKDDEKELFIDPLRNHTVIAVKGLLRRADLIPNAWKLRIGATHELHTKKVDNNVQAQGLPGRLSGYWRDIIEGGHKTGPYRTSIIGIEQFVDNYNNPLGLNSYQTAGYVKKEGIILHSIPTMVSTTNVKGFLNKDSNKNIKDFDISKLFNNLEEADTTLNKYIPIGRISRYTLNITDNTIQYRGNTIQLLTYDNYDQFIELDMHAGLDKTVAFNKIVCRIMPVMYQNNIKWIGIYKKNAYTLPADEI